MQLSIYCSTDMLVCYVSVLFIHRIYFASQILQMDFYIKTKSYFQVISLNVHMQIFSWNIGAHRTFLNMQLNKMSCIFKHSLINYAFKALYHCCDRRSLCRWSPWVMFRMGRWSQWWQGMMRIIRLSSGMPQVLWRTRWPASMTYDLWAGVEEVSTHHLKYLQKTDFWNTL